MKKPQLSDFGLTEKLVELNKQQHDEYWKRLEAYIEKRKFIIRTLFILSLVVTFIAFVIVACTGFEKNTTGYSMGICLLLDMILGLVWFQTHTDTTGDISIDRRIEIKKEVIDQKIDKAIESYKKAVSEYEEKVLSINEYSLVKAELLVPSFMEKGNFTSMGERWIVFTNIYLSNSRSFPDLQITIKEINNWEEKYYELIERQKSIEPKFKKKLGISPEDKVEFYYPYTSMYSAMQGKREGEMVTVNGCVPYRIIKVINPSDN